MKTLSYFYVKYSARVECLLLTVEKIVHENFDFVPPLSSFFVFIKLNSKVYGVYKRSAHQMNALLSEIILILVRAECELRSTSYGPKHASRWLSCTPF